MTVSRSNKPRSSGRLPPPNPGRISPRQLRILDELDKGHSYREVADLLNFSVNTLKTHVKLILAKTGSRSTREAAWKLRNQ